MTIIWVILAGGLLGWIASILTGRTERIGCLSNMFAGEIGAGIGGLIAWAFGSGLFVWGIIFAIAAIAITNRLFTTN